MTRIEICVTSNSSENYIEFEKYINLQISGRFIIGALEFIQSGEETYGG